MRISTKLEDTKMKTEQWQPKAAMTNQARKKPQKTPHVTMCTTPSDNTHENLEH